MRCGIVLVLTAMAAGCAVTQQQNTVAKETHEVDPTTKCGYWLFVPSMYDPGSKMYRPDRPPAPLIVTCHGTWPYDVANMHIREWKWCAEQNGCIVVAPELGATDGIFGNGPTAGMLSDEKFILSIISGLGWHYNIDRANVMITGFSGGGFPTYWVGLRHPDVFSVVVARSCNFSKSNTNGWWTPESLRIAIEVYYGDNDFDVIKSQSDDAVEYFRGAGFAVEKQIILACGHERHPEVAMEFFRQHWKTPRGTLPPPAWR
jgi:poly(3-hydroxybutyrate) depolymerase